MAGGRPSGIKNRSGRDAGGRRTGAGRPTAEESRNRAAAASAMVERQDRRRQQERAERVANGEEEDVFQPQM
eukprot:scaffold321521_cov35-Attheya_sp.AAC.1